MCFVYIKSTKHLKRAVYTRVEQFLCDDDFIRYVLDNTPDREAYWHSYLSENPQIRNAFQKAYDILLHLDDCNLLTPEQAQALKQRVFNTLYASAN